MLIDSETLITSSGIIRNRSKPRIGVINARSLYSELIDDCFNDGIDLTYESMKEETEEQIREENPNLDDMAIEQLVNESLEMVEFDSHVFLLGAWIKENNQYVIDETGKNGEWAIEYNTGTGIVCVEWSQLTKQCNNTSPCYVMADGSGPSGDLDTEGDAVTAYTVPNEMLRTDDNS